MDKVSQYPYLLRYDIEVSGFGSHQSGHLCLLRLQGADLSRRRFGQALADALPEHAALGEEAGRGLRAGAFRLGTGGADGRTAELHRAALRRDRRERIHRRRHPRSARAGWQARCRPSISCRTVDTPYVWELNMWYHTLNVGYPHAHQRRDGFPCIYGEQVGLGRSYVKLDGKLDLRRLVRGHPRRAQLCRATAAAT